MGLCLSLSVIHHSSSQELHGNNLKLHQIWYLAPVGEEDKTFHDPHPKVS